MATSVGVAWFELYGESKDVTFNRKEAKDHGEGNHHILIMSYKKLCFLHVYYRGVVGRSTD